MKQGIEAVQHLLRVAAGLDSLILGESEILGQVRRASELARSAGTNGPILSALFQSAVKAGKRARSETAICRENLSLAGIVVELAEESLGPLAERTALIIGAGKISSITARALVKAGVRCVMIANRTYERAQKIAKSLNGVAVHFDALHAALVQADIVICSTCAPHIVLHADEVAAAQQARGRRPLLVADLAVPRDADPQIASIPGVQLTNIDDLEALVKIRQPLTVSICRQVEAILQQELDAFLEWCAARRCASVIQALHGKAEDICEAEVRRTLRRLGPLSPRQERLVQAMGKAIAGRLLHEPTVRLRHAPEGGEGASFAEVVQELYGL
jgi:glutamyl-tRNA reductase